MYIQSGFTEDDVAWKVWLTDGTVMGIPFTGKEEDRDYVDILEPYDFTVPLLIYDGRTEPKDPRKLLHVINPDKILRIEIVK
jgi:hypothetical protein